MSAVDAPAHRTRPLRSAAPPASPPLARVAGFLTFVGWLCLLANWGAGASAAGVVAGVVFGMAGAVVRARRFPANVAARPREALSRRFEFAGWTGRRAVATALGGILLLLMGWLSDLVRDSVGPGAAGATWFACAAVGLALLRAFRPDADSAWRRAKPRTDATETPWERDRRWDPRGEQRRFLHYLRTREMVLGRHVTILAVLLLPVGGPGLEAALLLPLKLAFAAGAAWWMARAFGILGMGAACVGFVRVPCHPGERATFTFGVTAGGAEIRETTFVLRRFREVRDGGMPWCTLALPETGSPAPRTFVPGVDQTIEFDIPADAPGTAISSWRPSYWMVEVKGVTRAGGYEERFLVPVYARPRETAAPSPVEHPDVSVRSAPEQ